MGRIPFHRPTLPRDAADAVTTIRRGSGVTVRCATEEERREFEEAMRAVPGFGDVVLRYVKWEIG